MYLVCKCNVYQIPVHAASSHSFAAADLRELLLVLCPFKLRFIVPLLQIALAGAILESQLNVSCSWRCVSDHSNNLEVLRRKDVRKLWEAFQNLHAHGSPGHQSEMADPWLPPLLVKQQLLVEVGELSLE